MKPKPLCVQCQKPKLHEVHIGSTWEHEFIDPRPGWASKPRKPITPRSEKTEEYYRDVRRPAVAAIQGLPCEARVSDFVDLHESQRCTGEAEDIHEIVSRSQAGSLPLAVELGTMNVCRRCHNWITNNPVEAKKMGYRMSRKDVGL